MHFATRSTRREMPALTSSLLSMFEESRIGWTPSSNCFRRSHLPSITNTTAYVNRSLRPGSRNEGVGRIRRGRTELYSALRGLAGTVVRAGNEPFRWYSHERTSRSAQTYSSTVFELQTPPDTLATPQTSISDAFSGPGSSRRVLPVPSWTFAL
jgi:hypothetical protein